MRFSATNAVKSISFSIEHHCPQCGAPVFLDEADRYFACPYCRVKSCIAQKGFGRYFIAPAPDLPEDVELIFLPYWRFKGVRYACSLQGVVHWFADLSFLAVVNPAGPAPFSLGFRTQALPLRRVSARTRGRFVRPAPFATCFGGAAGRSPAGKRVHNALIREDIGETMSLIYAPFYAKDNQLYDGVLNTALGKDENRAYGEADLCRPERETLILPGVCPGCGWDLEGQSDSLVLICGNCDSLWQPRGNKLARIRYGTAVPAGGNDVLVPFWKISARIRGLSLNTKPDLLHLANLHGAGASPDPSAPLSFWAPAFKIRPRIFLRLSRHLTLAQPAPDLRKKIPVNSRLPITLPASEAVQSIRLTLASLARPLKDFLPKLAGARIDPAAVSLIFLPFEAHAHELIHREMNLAVNTHVIQLSGNL